MLLVAPVRASSSGFRDIGDARKSRDSRSCTCARSTVPAITHVDYSARVQTVDARPARPVSRAGGVRSQRRTGCPVLINTSFNVRGEPIVCEPEHAYRCFMATNMDVLVHRSGCVLMKHGPAETPPRAPPTSIWLTFALD